MKNLIFVLAVLVTVSVSAQEWGTVSKNKATFTEIAPTWPGCEGKKGSSIDACFKQKLAQHIGKNFRYPAAEYKNNVQGKVIVEFVINEQGMPVVKKVSGATAALQAEAKRNIMAIPKMSKPGMLAGKPRELKYTVPFTFKTGK